MAISEEWREAKYKEVFESEIRGLTRRVNSDLGCKTEDLEGILRSLYIINGTDQGCLQETINSATIAAYEHFITDLKAKRGSEI